MCAGGGGAGGAVGISIGIVNPPADDIPTAPLLGKSRLGCAGCEVAAPHTINTPADTNVIRRILTLTSSQFGRGRLIVRTAKGQSQREAPARRLPPAPRPLC